MVLPLARRTQDVNRVNIREMLQDIVEGLALVIGLLLVNLDCNVPEPLRRLLRQRIHIPDHHIRTAQIPAPEMPQIRVESPVAAYYIVGALQKIERIFLFRELPVSHYNRCSHKIFLFLSDNAQSVSYRQNHCLHPLIPGRNIIESHNALRLPVARNILRIDLPVP